MEKLISILIGKNNLDEAVKLQNKIFPRENGLTNFLESIEQIDKCKKNQELLRLASKYYLVNNGLENIGIWGIYTVNNNPLEAWLGWFGVLPEYRKNGYGGKIFDIFENYAKENGFETIRLYTDEVDNNKACRLYESKGMIKEKYQNPDDVSHEVGDILIFSKSLTDKKVSKWNNKNITLKEQEAKQSKNN